MPLLHNEWFGLDLVECNQHIIQFIPEFQHSLCSTSKHLPEPTENKVLLKLTTDECARLEWDIGDCAR